MNLHELVSRRVLALDRRHVGVANPSQSPVRRFDLLTRGDRRDAEDLVQRGHLLRAEVRRRSCLVRGAGGTGGEGAYWPEMYTCRGFGRGRGGGENWSGEECRGRSREHGTVRFGLRL